MHAIESVTPVTPSNFKFTRLVTKGTKGTDMIQAIQQTRFQSVPQPDKRFELLIGETSLGWIYQIDFRKLPAAEAISYDQYPGSRDFAIANGKKMAREILESIEQ